MTTLGVMEDRIADELARTDIQAQIRKAIKSAVAYYERRRFTFNEQRATATLSTGSAYYSLPSDFVEEDSLLVTVNGSSYPLVRRDWSYIDAIDTAGFTGEPTDYAIYAGQFRVYPKPNSTYTATLSYVKRLSTLSTTTDTNSWMTDAEGLIRSRAGWDVCLHVMRDREQANWWRETEADELMALTREAEQRASTGRVMPTAF
jgi:hypothetical protein